jgi:hypothetical protein
VLLRCKDNLRHLRFIVNDSNLFDSFYANIQQVGRKGRKERKERKEEREE